MDTNEIIDQMIDKIIDGDNTGAQDDFNTAVSAKMTSALDAKKIELAQSIYARQQQEPSTETDGQEQPEDQAAV